MEGLDFILGTAFKEIGMPPVRAAASMSPVAATHVGGHRVRSASPARRALALDMRRIANLLRDPAPAPIGDVSLNTSICSSPHSTLEPGERGVAPALSARNSCAVGSSWATNSQFSVLAERINAAVATLQWQCAEDRRKLAHLERKLETRIDERSTQNDSGREKIAEIQGSVTGLIEETQSLTRRVEGLDERLWARTSGSETSKQRNRELEQQVQALEHQSRLSSAAAEEVQKRQATKLRRSEHAIEDALRRLVNVEEQVRTTMEAVRSRSSTCELAERLSVVEEQFEQLSSECHDLQLQLDDGNAGAYPPNSSACDDGNDTVVDEALRASERAISAIDRRLTNQVEEIASSLASLRVKVDGQMQRVGTLYERLETAHAPAVDNLRSEIALLRTQDRRELDQELSSLRDKAQETAETNDELREALRQTRAEVAAVTLRSQTADDKSKFTSLEERLDVQERVIIDVRERLDSFCEPDQTLHPAQEDDVSHVTTSDEPSGLVPEVEDALRVNENNLNQLDKRLTVQVEELVTSLATIRVKVDGQSQRVAALSERVETAHEPATESLRAELTQLRTQDKREMELEVADVRKKIQELNEARENDEGTNDLRDALMKVRGEIESLCQGENSPILAVIDERCGANEEDLRSLRDRLDEMSTCSLTTAVPSTASKSGSVTHSLAGTDKLTDDVGDLTVKVSKFESSWVEKSDKLQVSLDGLTNDFGSIENRILALEKTDQDETKFATKSEMQANFEGQRKLANDLQNLQKQVDADAEKFGKNDGAQSGQDISALISEFRDDYNNLSISVAELSKAQEGLNNSEDFVLKSRLADIQANIEKASVPPELSKRVDDLESTVASSTSNSFQAETTKRIENLEAKIESNDFPKRLEELESKVGDSRPNNPSQEDILLAQRVERLESCVGDDADTARKELPKRVDALGDEVRETREELKKSSEGPRSVSELWKRIEQVDESTSLKNCVTSDEFATALKDVRSRLDNIGQKEGVASEEFASTLKGVRSRLDDVDRRVAGDKDALSELKKRSCDVEGKIASALDLQQRVEKLEALGDADKVAAQISEDSSLKSRVQLLVDDVGQKVCEEIAALSQHQEKLLLAQQAIEAASARGPAQTNQKQPGPSESSTAVRDLTQKVGQSLERLVAVENASQTFRKDLEQLMGTAAKVGITATGGSPGGSLSLPDVDSRLNMLTEQIEELKVRTGSTENRPENAETWPAADTPDLSLNFSLTEQTDRHSHQNRAAEGSLNLSATESRQDCSMSGSVPTLSAPPKRRTAATGLANTQGTPAEESETTGGVVKDSCAISPTSQSGSNDAEFDSEAAIGGLMPSSEKGDAARTTTSGVRSRAPAKVDPAVSTLARVDEETSDLGEQSVSVTSPSSVSNSKARLTALDTRRPDSPGSFSGGHDVNDVSISCNEVSFGGDYSVEDSCELDKCDHVEEVKSLGPLRLQALNQVTAKVQRVNGLKGALPADASLADASSIPITKGKTGVGGSRNSPLSQSKSKDLDEDDYGDESFEDNMSVPESIEEDVGASSGSDT